MRRTLIWFSCGVTSAVAARLALMETPDAVIYRIRISSEHEDGDRFTDEVASWLGHPIESIVPQPYDNHFDVVRYHGYVNGPTGAKCTRDLKRKVRAKLSKPDDHHVFGFDADEKERIETFRENNPDLSFSSPLADAGLTKDDCKTVIERAGIELPMLYRLGYDHNNCIGCVKGGQGYWNKIRRDFPDVFKRMAALEREIGATCLRHSSGPMKGQRLFLDQLDPHAGRFKDDQPAECGLSCEARIKDAQL